MSRTPDHICFIAAFAALALLANSAVLAAPAPQHEEDATAVKPSELGLDEMTDIERRQSISDTLAKQRDALEQAILKLGWPKPSPTTTSTARPAAREAAGLLKLKQDLAVMRQHKKSVRETIKILKSLDDNLDDLARHGLQPTTRRGSGAAEKPKPAASTTAPPPTTSSAAGQAAEKAAAPTPAPTQRISTHFEAPEHIQIILNPQPLTSAARDAELIRLQNNVTDLQQREKEVGERIKGLEDAGGDSDEIRRLNVHRNRLGVQRIFHQMAIRRLGATPTPAAGRFIDYQDY